MISITNETFTVPFLNICTTNNFWLGFIVGVTINLLIILIFKMIQIIIGKQ